MEHRQPHDSEAGATHSGSQILSTREHDSTMSNPITRLNAALEGRYRVERELGEGGMATVPRIR